MSSKPASYLEAVHESVVIFDGATGTNLQALNLGPDDFGGPRLEGCNEILCSTRPDVVAGLHRAFFDAGCQVVETDSFGSLPWVLAEYGIAGRARELARAAAGIAREVASSYPSSGVGRWVAGSLGPGTKVVSLSQIGFTEMRDGYEQAALGLLEGGVDLLLVETVQDLLQAKAAVIGCRRAMATAGREVPLQVQVTIETTGRMLMGSEIGAALTTLDALRPQVIGLNCATGPEEMGEHLRYLSAHCRVPISCQPNAGLPSVVDGKMHYDLSPEELAGYHRRFVGELGVRVVGGCCGTTPEHLRAVVEALDGVAPAHRELDFEPGCASLYSHVPYDQSPSVLSIGERTNANGSRAFREAMLAKDWDRCVSIAKEAVRAGSHAIDVCVDYTGADGVADMAEIAGRFATQSTLPLVLDSTEAPVIECGLQRVGGKPLINSVNLEEGDGPGTRLDKFLRLANEYGSAVVCTCIDEEGQARTASWKLRAAQALYELATSRYALRPEDLFFDALVLPVSTGMEESRRDGIETIEAIKLIKSSLPGARTLLGISNVSFGLSPAARQALNSVFLHECQKAGLDAAIVNSGRIVPLDRLSEEVVEVCSDLIYDRRSSGYDPLASLLQLFEGVSSQGTAKEDRSSWPVGRRLSQRVIDGSREGLEAELDESLAAGTPALDIVNGPLMDGMKTVGDLFGSGRMQLPFVLQSAEVMKAAVAYLEPHMSKSGQRGKGKIVLATVKGDVHDIGKNLVDIILTNNGYEVHNLGTKVALSEIVQRAAEVGADAIGMSGLLVKSTLIMRDNLLELNDRGLSDYPVLLGGAALTRTYVERDLRSEYKGRLFYGKDAFEGLHTMDRLMELRISGADDPDFGRAPGGRAGAPALRQRLSPAGGVPSRDAGERPSRAPSIALDNPVFRPPFLGTRVEKGIALDEIAQYLNETSLFRNQWGYRPLAGEDDKQFKARVRAQLREQLAAARESDVLQPAVVYGYFAASSEGDDLVIWSDESRSSEITRFRFPRQDADPWLCIADFFRPLSSGDLDYVAFHIVTMGPAASLRTAELFRANRYNDYLHLHGLSVEMTEALAEYWHRRIREEWGFAGEDGPTLTGLFRQQYRGGRYSWGYPACPDLEDNARCAWLIGAERIGVECSEATSWQFHPEQTTAAIICHHPQAKYFVVRRGAAAPAMAEPGS